MIYRRKDLPQLNEIILVDAGVPFTRKVVRPWELSPTQKDLRPQTEERYLKVMRNAYKPLIVDSAYKIIDGHHRLDLLLKLNVRDARILQTSISIEEVLTLFKK